MSDELANDRTYLAGVLTVLCGAALIVVGYLQHTAVSHVLEHGDGTQRPRWPLIITTFGVAGSLLLSALIVLTT